LQFVVFAPVAGLSNRELAFAIIVSQVAELAGMEGLRFVGLAVEFDYLGVHIF